MILPLGFAIGNLSDTGKLFGFAIGNSGYNISLFDYSIEPPDA
ncbi:MAG: hypothetical protein SH857_02140 [Chitinophagales bacterium]|nr:hypothetical protein [Chitinophagales bacterium]